MAEEELQDKIDMEVFKDENIVKKALFCVRLTICKDLLAKKKTNLEGNALYAFLLEQECKHCRGYAKPTSF